MIFNRDTNRSCEIREKYKKSEMFTPKVQQSRMRKESIEYNRNKGLNNSTGEIVMQTRKRVAPEKSSEKMKEFQGKGRVQDNNSE